MRSSAGGVPADAERPPWSSPAPPRCILNIDIAQLTSHRRTIRSHHQLSTPPVSYPPARQSSLMRLSSWQTPSVSECARRGHFLTMMVRDLILLELRRGLVTGRFHNVTGAIA